MSRTNGAAPIADKYAPFQPYIARNRIGGRWVKPARTVPIVDPYRSTVVGRAPVTTLAELGSALDAATAARAKFAAVPGFERAALLRRIAASIERDVESLATLLTRETGKAIRDAEDEIRRSVETFSLAAEEAIRIEGRHVPLDGSAMGAGRLAMLLRFPVGVVAAITPYDAPFDLAAHKIAPSIAAGNTMVLKPPPQAPLIVHRLAELVVEAGAPAGVLNVVHGGATIGKALVADPRVDFITFTGSSRVGAAVRAASGLRRVALELGGNGATIVHEDADIARAAAACARDSMRLAGQSCLSVQSVHVHASVADRFLDCLVAEVGRMKLGDPLDPATDIGTLIDEAAAQRIEQWVHDAADEGAHVLTGGRRHGAAFEPTVLTRVTPTMKVVCEEAFGPVVNVTPYDTLDGAFAAIDASPYGLQAGLFTKSNEVTFAAIRALRVGGLIVNGTSSWRTDQLAYGGVKASGIGREGPRYAIEDMTEQRLVVFDL